MSKRPTVAAYKALHDDFEERKEAAERHFRLWQRAEQRLAESELKLQISDARLVEVQTHLTDIRTVLGLGGTITPDHLKYLRQTLAERSL